jgi:hypothetical protein
MGSVIDHGSPGESLIGSGEDPTLSFRECRKNCDVHHVCAERQSVPLDHLRLVFAADTTLFCSHAAMS